MPQFQTTRFGPIDLDEHDIITMPEGMVGFGGYHRFVLLEEEEYKPFIWYQSLDDPDLCFILTDPLLFFPDYEVNVRTEEITPIDLTQVADARVLVVLVVPEDPRDATANLQGPLIFNANARKARQLVLLDDRYSTRHRLIDSSTPVEQSGG